MAYYDKGFNVGEAYGTGPRAGFGKAILGGIKAGQDMRTTRLGQQATQQKMDQSALGQKDEQQDRQIELTGAAAAQVNDQASYDRFRDFMRSELGETDEGLLEDGLIPEYNTDVAGVLKQAVGVARGVPALGKEKADFTLGRDRYSGTTSKMIAKGRDAPVKPKAVPITFAKNFNDRLEMDIESLNELPQEDIKRLKDATSAKLRKGGDFEKAYNDTLEEFGLKKTGAWFGEDYEIDAQAEEKVSTGESINQKPDAEEQKMRTRLDEIKKIRKERGF